MLGAIIGDIVGSRYEFNPTNDYNFQMFGPGCGFTDDTICTFGVAGALINPKYSFGKSIHWWCERHPSPKGGYGGRFHSWVFSDSPKPYGSFGNGSAMRVSPVGWWYQSREEMLETAKATAECTHNHPEGVKGAQTVALAVWTAARMRLENKTPDVETIIRECVEFSGYDIDIDMNRVRNRFDETCPGTVPVALAIIRDSHSFEDALRRAVSLGADADTLGAIVGSIAEPIWGIPNWMKEKALSYLTSEMKHILTRFRVAVAGRRRMAKEEEEKTVDALLFWKLGLGNMGSMFNGEDAMPVKKEPATFESWKTEPMPPSEECSTVRCRLLLSEKQAKILALGHIPNAMEDHWFMFCDEHFIRYYRSWTGTAAFRAHYAKTAEGYVIDLVTMNRALGEFGVNGDDAGMALFRYLIEAETGGDWQPYWQEFLAVRKATAKKLKG